MIKSVMQCSCFSHILKSSNKQSSAKSNKAQSIYFESVKIYDKKFNSSKKESMQKENLQNQNAKLIVKQIVHSNSLNAHNQIKISKKLQSNLLNSNIKQSQGNRQNDIQQLQSDRKFTFYSQDAQNQYQEQQQNQQHPISQSDENQLATQKSEIIINDLNANIDKIQNNYLNSSSKYYQQIWKIYQIQQNLYSNELYHFYTVRNKNNHQICEAKCLKKFDQLAKQWNLDLDEAIEQYNDIYESQKQYFQCLLTINKKNCQHFTKIIDYQLKPPFIDIGNYMKYEPGSMSILYEHHQESLTQFFNKQQNQMSKLEKKRLIHHIIIGISEIYKNNIFIRDFSLKNIFIDKFNNIKIFSNKLTKRPLSNDKKVYKQLKNKQIQYFLSPQQIEFIIQQESNKNHYLNELNEEKIMIWKLGIMCFKLIKNKYLFEGGKQEILEQIKSLLMENNQSKKSLFMCTKLVGCTFHETQLIESLLKWDSQKRVNFQKLLKSDYFENFIEDSCEYIVSNDFIEQNREYFQKEEIILSKNNDYRKQIKL